MNALIDAFDYRADEGNWDECINMAMKFDQLEYKDYDMTAGYILIMNYKIYHIFIPLIYLPPLSWLKRK